MAVTFAQHGAGEFDTPSKAQRQDYVLDALVLPVPSRERWPCLGKRASTTITELSCDTVRNFIDNFGIASDNGEVLGERVGMVGALVDVVKSGGNGSPEQPVRHAALHITGQLVVAAILVGTLTLPYIGGAPLAYLLMVLTLLLGLWLVFARSPTRIPIGPAGWFFAASVGTLVAAFVLNGDGASVANFAPFLLFPVLAAGLSRFSSPKAAIHVANLALVGSVISLLAASYQVFGMGMPRAAGIWSDEIWSAAAALTQGFVALIGVRAQKGRSKWIYLLGPLFAMATVLLSGSRGPMLAIPVLVLVSCFAAFRRPWVALPIGACAIATLSTIGVLLNPDIAARFESILTAGGQFGTGAQVTDVSSDTRLSMLKSAWAAFGQSPWIGYGWGGRMAAVSPYLNGVEWGVSAQQFHLHNDMANFAVGAGLLGVAAYLAILVAPVVGALRSGWDCQRSIRIMGCITLTTAYACLGISNSFFGFEYHNVLYVFGAAILLNYCRDGPERSVDGR